MHVNFNEGGEIHHAHRADIVIDSMTTCLLLSMPTVKSLSSLLTTESFSTEMPDHLQNHCTFEIFLIVLQSLLQLGCPLLIRLRNN